MIYHTRDITIKGLYSQLPQYGSLPNYIFSISELATRVELQQKRFMEFAKKKYPDIVDELRERHMHEFYWGPIRISKYGTIEYRGLDMNSPSFIMAAALLLKKTFERVKKDNLRVLPSDIGMRDPFLIEGNVLHVPPYSYVAGVLQKKAAINGTDSSTIRDYIKRLVNFAFKDKKELKKKRYARINQILITGKNRSDMILKDAVNMHWTRGTPLKDDIAKKLALASADELEREIRNVLEKKNLT